MAISEELAKILAARYGRDVRQAIHDAISENYEDVSSAKTLADSATIAANNAASLANTKAGLADEKASLANTKAGLADEAATAANDAASLANTKAGLADEAAQDATDAAAYANAITQKYIHIRYSAINPDSDDDMVSTPSDWIGIYSGTSASAPTAYTAYTWFKYKGETGDLSIYGVGNADGNIPLNNGVVSVNLNADKLDGLNSTDFAAASHPHVKADITDFPTSMPASDVSAWAKEATKPEYTPSEVGAAPAVHNHDSAYLGKAEKAADSDKLDGVHLTDIRLGQNILSNWDFRNPVDQRGRAGQSRAFSFDFAYDRWSTYNATTLTLVPNSHVVISSGGIFGQGIEGLWLMGKTVTVSILGTDGIIRFGTGAFSGIIGGTSSFQISGFGGISLVNTTDHTRLYLIPDAERSIVAVKLELGPVSTLHLDPPMDHAVEFPKCRRYYKNDFRLMGKCGHVSAGTITMVLTFETGFRINPTVAIPSYTNLLVCPNVAEYTPSSHTIGGITKYHVSIDFHGTFTGANYGAVYTSNSSASLMSLSADL